MFSFSTTWNSTYSRVEAVPFSVDGDYTTFNDAEQAAIKKVWQHVAEDFAPLNINLTTARPATFTTTTGTRYSPAVRMRMVTRIQARVSQQRH